MNVGKTLLLCAAATLASITIVFVTPAPFHSGELVLAVDAIVLIVGAVAMIVLPVVVMRSRWAALVVVIAIPAFLFSVYFGTIYVPYGWAWLRCMRQPW